ncbi:hypothetical protein [Microseira wollei]|uniref:hypothetical protein n=1 Tax=Microseira wollei TaxID=467598 RepID=UPI001CFD0957|nr:hypothetical protein [Microseira wollei]
MKHRRRRFQADISEALFIAIGATCDRLAVSKSEFTERALLAALRSYCEADPEAAAQSLLDLLQEAEKHLL